MSVARRWILLGALAGMGCRPHSVTIVGHGAEAYAGDRVYGVIEGLDHDAWYQSGIGGTEVDPDGTFTMLWPEVLRPGRHDLVAVVGFDCGPAWRAEVADGDGDQEVSIDLTLEPGEAECFVVEG